MPTWHSLQAVDIQILRLLLFFDLRNTSSAWTNETHHQRPSLCLRQKRCALPPSSHQSAARRTYRPAATTTTTHDRNRYVAEPSDWVTNVAQLLAAELERESFRAAFHSQTSGGGGGSKSSRHSLNTAGPNRSTDRSTGPKHNYNNNGRGRGPGRRRGHNNSSERTSSSYNNNNRGRSRGRGRSSRSRSYNPDDYDQSKPCKRSRYRTKLVDKDGTSIPLNNGEMPNCSYSCHLNNCVRNNSAGVHHQFFGQQLAAHTGAETHCRQRAL